MATSGVNTYTITSLEIMQEALELLGVLGEGEIITLAARTSCQRTLNMLVKNWQADGLNLFSVQKSYIFPVLGQKSYTLGPGSIDNVTNSFETTTIISQPTAFEIVVEDTDGMTSGDYIGFETTENTLVWDIVSGTTTEGVVAIEGTVENLKVGGTAYFYTTKASKPMNIIEAYINSSGTDTPLGQLSRNEYNELSQKNTKGRANQFYYDPQVLAGYFYVWPTGAAETDIIVLHTQRAQDVFVDPNVLEDVDYPMEWYMPMAYGLAKALAPKYGIPKLDYDRIFLQAAEYYETARGFDTEMYTSVFFQPDTMMSST